MVITFLMQKMEIAIIASLSNLLFLKCATVILPLF